MLQRLPPHEAYDIPLLTAGRCSSGGHEAHSSYRVTPIAMATGHAAGVCGALAARAGRIPREIPARDVQRELLRQGASPRPDLRESLARNAR